MGEWRWFLRVLKKKRIDDLTWVQGEGLEELRQVEQDLIWFQSGENFSHVQLNVGVGLILRTEVFEEDRDVWRLPIIDLFDCDFLVFVFFNEKFQKLRETVVRLVAEILH